MRIWAVSSQRKLTVNSHNKNVKYKSRSKTNRLFQLCYPNIQELRGDCTNVQFWLSINSPDILALCKTNLNYSISEKYLTHLVSYCSILTNHDYLNLSMRGHGCWFVIFRLDLLHSSSSSLHSTSSLLCLSSSRWWLWI